MDQRSSFWGASIVALAFASAVAPTSAMAQQAAKETSAQKRDREAKERAEMAAAKAPANAPAAQAPAATGDVVVTGVRSSLAAARDKKRNSDSIVDVVEAEDIGKLPNNTVGDAIAALPGIDADRREGEVDNVRLRGFNDTQTTIGGTPLGTGVGGGLSIADLPAELVKSVELYKTRSPDQVEGSGGGTVNVELLRPTDFKTDGLSLFGQTQQRYNQTARKLNSVYSATANYKLTTGIGKFGATLGVALNDNPYLEPRANSDTIVPIDARQVLGQKIISYPAFVPSQIRTSFNSGSRRSRTLRGALAWELDDNRVLIEASNIDSQQYRNIDELYLPIAADGLGGNANTRALLSNIVFHPDSDRVASLSVAPLTPLGTIGNTTRIKSNTGLYTIKADHRESFFDLSTEVSYNTGNLSSERAEVRNRLLTRPTYDIILNDTEYGFGRASGTVNGINLLDPSEYRFFSFIQNKRTEKLTEFATRFDVTLRPAGFVDRLQFGGRFASRKRTLLDGTRTADGYQVPQSGMPGIFGQLAPIEQSFSGTPVKESLRWLGLPGGTILDNVDLLREYVTPRFPAFATKDPISSAGSNRRDAQRSFAFYGNAAFKARVIFPVQLSVGARVINVIREANGLSRSGPSTNYVYTPFSTSSNVIYFEPTITGRVNYTNNLFSRFSFNRSTTPPNFDQLRSAIEFDANTGIGSTGNPDLQPESRTKWDATLEWYPGRIATFVFNPFYWKRSGVITNFTLPEVFEDRNVSISRPYNSGDGYKRGFELSGTTFFRFAPGLLKNFGLQASYTYTETNLEFTAIPGATSSAPVSRAEQSVPKNLYSIVGLFERGGLNARVTYTFRGKLINNYDAVTYPQFTSYAIAVRNVDAAINYTFTRGAFKNLALSLQVQNLTGVARRTFRGYPDFPLDTWYNGRTIGGAIRYSF